ncbi:MAG: sigma-70 family RNA polymerase sigma factor [Candidatus Omnitrophica bacterium]|nr:sigma-70 family RNA polymerase sigma factor [Candidatus Omnitrophota bacterium]
MNEDNKLIGQFLAGDIKGFEMLVKKYQNRTLNIVYSLVGNDRDSEDIVQEVFIKAYHGLGGFRGSAQFSTWLYRISVNTTYDFLRKRRHTTVHEDVSKAKAVIDESSELSLSAREKKEEVQKALDSIPFHYRSAVVLKDIEGLGYADIARALGCSIGTVESRIYRARQLLREKLSDPGGR